MSHDAPPPVPGEGREPAVGNALPPDLKFPCLKCGAKLDFDPGARSLKCPYCGYAEKVDPQSAASQAHDLDEYLSRQTGQSTVQGRSCEVKCNTCGAVVLLEDKVAADRCPYCSSFLENKPTSAQAMIAPEWVLPFAVDNRKASDAFSQWLAGLWFAPNALRKAANLGKLSGVYVPFWMFDSMTYTHYSGERGDDYQVTEHYTETENYQEDGETKTRQVNKTRQVTRTRWSRVTGDVNNYFKDVCICASTSLPGHYTATLTPNELQALEAFRPEFLSGFTTERYTIGPKDGFNTAKEIMDGEIRQLCMRDIGGDHQKLNRVETQHVDVTFRHVLLPVWLASYRYRDKSYQVLVNGQTGNVTGDRPYSAAKITALVLTILAVILAIVLFFFAMKARGATVSERPAAVERAAGFMPAVRTAARPEVPPQWGRSAVTSDTTGPPLTAGWTPSAAA
jgi:DNA-directed RNA polymerase subunit RPC12/RpoP